MSFYNIELIVIYIEFINFLAKWHSSASLYESVTRIDIFQWMKFHHVVLHFKYDIFSSVLEDITHQNCYYYVSKYVELSHCHVIWCLGICWQELIQWILGKSTSLKLQNAMPCPGPYFNINTLLSGTGIPLVKIRWSWDHLIFIMGTPIEERVHIHIELALWNLLMFSCWICFRKKHVFAF